MVLSILTDNHKASQYQIVSATGTRSIAKKLEFHFTPKHEDWLAM